MIEGRQGWGSKKLAGGGKKIFWFTVVQLKYKICPVLQGQNKKIYKK